MSVPMLIASGREWMTSPWIDGRRSVVLFPLMFSSAISTPRIQLMS